MVEASRKFFAIRGLKMISVPMGTNFFRSGLARFPLQPVLSRADKDVGACKVPISWHYVT